MGDSVIDINGLIAIAVGIVGSGYGFFIKRWMNQVDGDLDELQDATNALIPRLVIVETQSAGMIQRLDRIESKIDSLIDKLPRQHHDTF